MKKINLLISALALINLVSCKSDSMTETEMFQKLNEILYSFSTQEQLSINSQIIQEHSNESYENATSNYLSNEIYSTYDLEKDIFASNQKFKYIYDENEYEHNIFNKRFMADNNYYMAEIYETISTQANQQEISKQKFYYDVSDYEEIEPLFELNYLQPYIRNIFKANDTAEIKTCFEGIMETYGFKTEDSISKIETSFDSNIENGFAFTLEISYEKESETTKNTTKEIREYVIQDDKLKNLNISFEDNYINTISENEFSNSTIKSKLFTEINYEFDNELYNSIETQLPSKLYIMQQQNIYDKTITVDLGDFEVDIECTINNNNDFPYNSALTEGLNQLYNGGYGTVSETLYYDEAMTIPFVPEKITEEEYFKLEKLYGSVELTTDNLVIEYKETNKFNCSRNSMLVTDFEEGDLNSYVKVHLGNQITLAEISPSTSTIEVYVDGEKKEFGDTITLSTGTVHKIEYRHIFTDFDINARDLFIGGYL